ncbi:uncharacterized protein LOC134531990 isoform X2 [Bacillus rossius redtenbacheri]|uniref:uncharacterized protein LOC134531990 isoform X2 n=1 Tax=Bacillus rossius redtenbacheri TaxID=93214 RepID=UPI002FDEBD49
MASVMDVVLVPFDKGLVTQLYDRNDVCSVKGGFIKGSQCTWLARGPRLYLASTADGSQADLWTFADVAGAGGEAGPTTTEATCVAELAPGDGGPARQLLVGLDHNHTTGMVCVYDTRVSRVVRAVHVPGPVTSLVVVDHGLGSRESRQALHQVLREMDGILAVGLSKGEVFLVDLRRSDFEHASHHSHFRDELNCCYLLPVSASNPRLRNEERLRRQEGDHLCVFINSMYLRETGMLVDKTAQTGCELIGHDVSVSCMQFVPLIVGLVVGYDEGFFQLWNIRTLKLEFSSYVRNKMLGRLSHVVFQEPNDDPHPVCYLWTAHEGTRQHAAVLYSLVYGQWDHNSCHEYLYKGFVSALELSVCDMALGPGEKACFLDCYCLDRVKETVRIQGSEEADLSLAVFAWEKRKGGRVTTHAHLFDMNEWLKEHRCTEEDRMQRSCVAFPVPDGALALAVPPGSLRHFATLQRLDKHLSPHALSFQWLALMPDGVEKGWCEGVQRTLVSEILSRGPTCLADPGLVARCVDASLQPTIGCDELPQTETERKKFLLNLMLEYCYSPDVFLGSSDNASDFRLLSLLHAWGWERAQSLKDNIDHLSVRLFDLTGVRVDEMWHSELRHCGTQLLTLHMLFSQLERLAGESLSNIWEHKEGIMLMHVYYVVLQWFVTKGLLPESMDGRYGIPYPVVEIKQFYLSRRRDLAERGQTLFIDQFLERECEQEDLLRLGLANGRYPPLSVQCLVKMYLLSEIPLNVKNILTTYVFKDVIVHLDENRRLCATQELEDFSTKLQLTESVVRLAESLWLFDHGSFQEGVAVLADNGVSPGDVMPWLHTSIVNTLVSQHQFAPALAFMRWNKMASKSKDDARLYLTVCLAERSFDTAVQFVHEFCREGTWRDVLQHFFISCERSGLLRKVMHQPLSDYEEQEFLNYLRRSSSLDSEDMRVLYFTMRGRVAEGLAENDRINRERLHKPRRRPLHCDEVPLRQVMANIYRKVRPKDWAVEEDHHLSLLLPTMEKTMSDDILHEKNSGSAKRPTLSREVRSTLHSLYVSSPGLPPVLGAQPATSTPQGILKVRSYPSTRDTSVETLATASSTAHLDDVAESEPATPAKRIQFRISPDSEDKMECDEGVDEQEEEAEEISALNTKHEKMVNAKTVGFCNEKEGAYDTLAQRFSTNENESDNEVVPSDDLRQSGMADEIQRAIKESSVVSNNSSNFDTASEKSRSEESTAAQTPVSQTTTNQSLSSSPWLVTDVSRFSRSGIGPRRPLPSTSREAASKMLVSTVTKKTRTTESSVSIVEEVDLGSTPERRRLNFDAEDPSERSLETAPEERCEIGKIITVEVERRESFQICNTRNENGSSALDTSGGSSIEDVLNIDISDEIFSDETSKVGGKLQLYSTANLGEKSDTINVSQIKNAWSDETEKHVLKSLESDMSKSLHMVNEPLLNQPLNLYETCDASVMPGESSTYVSMQRGLEAVTSETTRDTTVHGFRTQRTSKPSISPPAHVSFTNKTQTGNGIYLFPSRRKTSSVVTEMSMKDMQSPSGNIMPAQTSVETETTSLHEEGSKALALTIKSTGSKENKGTDIVVSAGLQNTVPREAKKIPFGLSLELLSRETHSSLALEDLVQETESSCGNQGTTGDKVSKISGDVTLSTIAQVVTDEVSKTANTCSSLVDCSDYLKQSVSVNLADKPSEGTICMNEKTVKKKMSLKQLPAEASSELLPISSACEDVEQAARSMVKIVAECQVTSATPDMSPDGQNVAAEERIVETSETMVTSSEALEECTGAVQKPVVVSFSDQQNTVKNHISHSVCQESAECETETSGYDLLSATVQAQDAVSAGVGRGESIPNDLPSKISEQSSSSCVGKTHERQSFKTNASISNESDENNDKILNVVDSSVKVVVEDVSQQQGTEIVCTDSMEMNMSGTPSVVSSSQMEELPSSTIIRESVVEEVKEPVEPSETLTCIPVESVTEVEIASTQVVLKSGIESGQRENINISSKSFLKSQVSGSKAKQMAVERAETTEVSCSLSIENDVNKTCVGDSLSISSSEDLRSTGSRVDAVQSVSNLTCASSTVPSEAVESGHKAQESGRGDSENLTQCLPTKAIEEPVISASVFSAASQPPTDKNSDNDKIDSTSSEVVQPNLEIIDSQQNEVMEFQKGDEGGDVSSGIVTETSSDLIGMQDVVAAESQPESSNVVVGASESDVQQTADNSRSSLLGQESQEAGLHSEDKGSVSTVPAGGVLELRSRSVDRSLDSAHSPMSLGVKRETPPSRPPAGALKRRLSMSVLDLNLGEEAEVSTPPPRRQRRASLSCSDELSRTAPSPRRSLRLSSRDDDAGSTASAPATRRVARDKKRTRTPKKLLQTVFEDTELSTDGAKAKLDAENPSPDTRLSKLFMMPRRLTRSQLRMMKQNVRLEEIRSFSNKSPSSAGQMSAEDDASDEEGPPPSLCGSEVSSLVTVSEDQSEGGQSPRVRRRSYNLRSLASLSPVSEVSRAQSTSSHDDISSVVSGMSESRHRDLELGSPLKDGVKGGRPSRKTRSNRLSVPAPEELSSPTDSQQSQATEEEGISKTRQVRRSPRRSQISDSPQQAFTSLSDAGPSPAAKDDEASSSSSSDRHMLPRLTVLRQKRDKRRQARQVSGAANPTKKTKVSAEDSASSSRSGHARSRYSRSAVHGRKSVRVRSSLPAAKSTDV